MGVPNYSKNSHWRNTVQQAYGSDVVILAEVGLTSYKVENYAEGKNEEAIRLQLDLVDEVYATAEQRLTQY